MEFNLGEYVILYDRSNLDGKFCLEGPSSEPGENECHGMWDDIDEMLNDIDYQFGSAISNDRWNALSEWAKTAEAAP
jgi:hypothetical protein